MKRAAAETSSLQEDLKEGAYPGATMPGVSNITTCVLPAVNAPNLLLVVVFVLSETAETCTFM
jgi:hypothetical protein